MVFWATAGSVLLFNSSSAVTTVAGAGVLPWTGCIFVISSITGIGSLKIRSVLLTTR